MSNKFFKNIYVERKKRLNSQTSIDNIAVKEWVKNLNSSPLKKHKKDLSKLYVLARNLDYKNHKNLTYFSHTLRVANMSNFFQENLKLKKELIILGLFHNIIESSNLDKNFLSWLLGKKIYNQINILTVNRKKEKNKYYINSYYRKLYMSHKNLRIIKILDKIDNLFIIGLCENNKQRKDYINHIKKYICPMILKDTPILYNYVLRLIEDSHKLGYYNAKTFNE